MLFRSPDSGKWNSEAFESSGGQPSSWDTYKKFRKIMEIGLDRKTGILTVAMTHQSPKVAFDLVKIFTYELNKSFQLSDVAEARNNISYLEAKISETQVSEMEKVLYQMIERQTQTLMLAEVSEHYLLKTIVPPMVSEEKSKPNRAVICILVTVFGALVSLLGCLIYHFVRVR